MRQTMWLEGCIPPGIVLAVLVSIAQNCVAATLASPVNWGSPDRPWGERRAVTAADRAAIAAYRSGHKVPIFSANFTGGSELQSDWTFISDDSPANKSCRRPASIEPSTAGLRLKGKSRSRFS